MPTRAAGSAATATARRGEAVRAASGSDPRQRVRPSPARLATPLDGTRRPQRSTLSGNLTRDVELRALPSGTDAARLRVATTTRRKAGDEWVDKTNYFTVEVYGAAARSCAQYLGKGSRVLVDAELDWREWTDSDEKKREAVTLRAPPGDLRGRPPGARRAP